MRFERASYRLPQPCAVEPAPSNGGWSVCRWPPGFWTRPKLARRDAVDTWLQQGSCLRVVAEWATRRRQADKADIGAVSRGPSARTIARLITIGRDGLSKSETVLVAAIERGAPSLVQAREIIAPFQTMVRRKLVIKLDPWLVRAGTSLVAPFAKGDNQRQSCGQRGDFLKLVQWSNRGSNHQAEARQAPDVRARQARLAPCSPHWCRMTASSSKLRQRPCAMPIHMTFDYMRIYIVNGVVVDSNFALVI